MPSIENAEDWPCVLGANLASAGALHCLTLEREPARPPLNLAKLRAMVADASREPHPEGACRGCSSTYAIDSSDEPTALCHDCAHLYTITFAAALPALIAIAEAARDHRYGSDEAHGRLRRLVEEYLGPCQHMAVIRGADVPLRYGSHRTQVCISCGAFRTHGHDAARSQMSHWRPAESYAMATAPIEDDE